MALVTDNLSNFYGLIHVDLSMILYTCTYENHHRTQIATGYFLSMFNNVSD